MKKKPLDLRRFSDRETVLLLAQGDEEFRWAAFQQLGARGEKRGWDVYGLLTRDPQLARLFVSPKDPFDAVGVVVNGDTYERIRLGWPSAAERVWDGRRELTIDFRNLRLDVMTLVAWAPENDASGGQEGLGEIKFRVTDVAAFVARVERLEGDLRGRLSLLPSVGAMGGEAPSALPPSVENRFLLAQIRAPRGARSVLVQLVPL